MKEQKNLIAPIPTPDAVMLAKNWRDFNAANKVNDAFYMNAILPNAFTFDLQDVIDVTLEMGISKVRIYFGYVNSNPGPNPELPVPMKAMLVGVDKDGKDILFGVESPVSGVYDFALPCPSTCDLTSPLAVDAP